jgi:ribosomal protein S18 acetylase RimI-like enzyme
VRVRIPPRALTIRAATVDDARAIAEVHVASWRAGYRGLMADAYLADLSVEQRVALWETILADGETSVLVAGEGVEGFVAFNPRTGEIGALYVAPARFREGVGSALLAAAHDALVAAGRRESTLWVVEGNEPAFAFYERHGYVRDNAIALHEPTGLEQIRMARQVRE